MATQEHIKRVAIKLLKLGLFTQAEIAERAGITRQSVGEWTCGIDCVGLRKAWLDRRWAREMRRNQPE